MFLSFYLYFKTGQKLGDSQLTESSTHWSLHSDPHSLYASPLPLLQPTWLTHGGFLPIPLFPEPPGGFSTHARRGLQWQRRSQRRHQHRASLPGGMTLLHFARICKYCEGAAAQCRISGIHTHTHSAPLTWVCIVSYISPRGYQTSLSCLLTLLSHKCAGSC